MTSLLSTYTSLFCFLLLAFIFYSRHQLARVMFAEAVGHKFPLAGRGLVKTLPLLLLVAALFCAFYYPIVLSNSVGTWRPGIVHPSLMLSFNVSARKRSTVPISMRS